jgi:hypothetical protein
MSADNTDLEARIARERSDSAVAGAKALDDLAAAARRFREAIDQAALAHAAEITSILKAVHAAALIEFAKLEFAVVRLQR